MPFARKSIHPTPHPLHLFLFFLAFSFVLFFPSGLLGVIQTRLVNARPAPPPAPPAPFSSFLAFLFVSFFSSGLLGGIQARLVNALRTPLHTPGKKKKKEKEKKEKEKKKRKRAKRQVKHTLCCSVAAIQSLTSCADTAHCVCVCVSPRSKGH